MRRAFCVACWLLAASMTVAVQAAPPVPDELFGMDLTPYWNETQRFSPRMADDLTNCGVRWLRVNFRRENSLDIINWQAYDTILARAYARGIAVLGLICYDSKQWNSTNDWTSDAWQNAFSNRVAQIVSRYRTAVTAWEVWNEPIRLGTIAPEPFARLHLRAYRAIKNIDPSATVVFGALEWPYYDATNYLQAVYRSPAFQAYYADNHTYPYDALSIHPYAFEYDPATYLAAQVGIMRQTMTAAGERAKRIWVTELGWANTNSTFGISQGSQLSNDLCQARYLASAYQILGTLTEPGFPQYGPYVAHYFYFCYEDIPESPLGVRAFSDAPDTVLGPAKRSYAAYRTAARTALHNLARRATVVAASGAITPDGTANRINDRSLSSGWCATNAGPRFVILDLGAPCRIDGYTLLHAELAGRPPACNTRAALIETASAPRGPWTRHGTLANAAGAPCSVVTGAAPVVARFVKLTVTQAGAGADDAARVAEWQVWGAAR